MKVISDKLREELLSRARSRRDNLPGSLGELFDGLESLDELRQGCLAFLLAELPETDLLNYDLNFFLEHIEQSLRSCSVGTWANTLRDEFFLVYILMPRVNTEPLVLHRDYFRKELEDSLKDLSLEEAILECNYYCYSKGTYQSTDGRTVSPLTFVDRAGGRCGEESTFVVSVLRSVGIPARQMYSPYWAHTDDNHAWVEAWTGSSWAYFGACEPEARLNCGWFDGAARRAKLILSRTFSELSVPGDDYLAGAIPRGLVNQSKEYFATHNLKINLHYGEEILSKKILSLNILNYASDSPILTLEADSKGETSVDISEGSLLISVTHKGLVFEKWIEINEDYIFDFDLRDIISDVISSLDLSHTKFDSDSLLKYFDELNDEGELSNSRLDQRLINQIQLEILKLNERDQGLFRAPSIKETNVEEISAEAAEIHKKKFEEAKAKLDATNDSFFKLDEKAEEDDIDMGLVRNKSRKRRTRENILHWARLNMPRVEKLLDEDSEDLTYEQKLSLFTCLSNKDISDISEEVFYDHGSAFLHKDEDLSRENVTEEVWEKYILSPRFERENLSAWRGYLNSCIDDELKDKWRESPRLIEEWVKCNVSVPKTSDYGGIYVQPEKCMEHLRGNAWSRRLLTLAISRSIGVAAYSESMSQRAMFVKGDAAIPFRQEDILLEVDPKEKARLTLEKKNESDIFSYSSQFSLKQLASGSWRHVNPENIDLSDNKSSDLLLDPGIYAINIVKRLQNGDQVFTRKFFCLDKGDEFTLVMSLPEESEDVGRIKFVDFRLKKMDFCSYENTISDNKNEVVDSGFSEISAEELFAAGQRIFIFLEASGEPYSHLINDLNHSIGDLKKYSDLFTFVVSKKEDVLEERLAKFKEELGLTSFYLMDAELPKYLYNKFCCSLRELPIVTLFDNDGGLLFSSTGYRINTDQELLQYLRRIN